ncbi:MAG TPA: radical SAM/SPASM domain-containing protein [Candidatus Binatia bacterium]|jgi:2-deoxy-scyllo-inosamine dehydrogenase (SAM-dependent)/8-amino-3,8-dideoxy-alpha-D-manno-octulosonate transaminase
MAGRSPETSKIRIPLFERMQIESQSNCNRSCWFCPRTYDRTGKYLDEKGNAILNQMPTEKILDLLNQAQAMGFTGRVGFYHYSEPLLDKRNILLAQEARKRGMKPYLHTNGDVLKHDDALCEKVKRAYGLIVVGLYDYKTNEELDQAKEYWQKRLAGSNLKFSPIGLSGGRTAYSMGVPKALVPSDSRMAVPDITFTNAPCHRPLIRMIVQYDGEMCNCCEDTHGAFKLGNVYQNSLEELWFSDQHAELVKDLIEGRREKYDLCGNCPLAPTGPASNGKKIDILPRRSTLGTTVQ